MTRKKPDASEASTERLALYTAASRAAGIRLTPQRLEIFRVLAATESHPDAEAVHRAVQRVMPTVSRDTVYRTLWRLHDMGLVATLGPSRDRVRFDTNVGPHHHLVCLGCGLVQDFVSATLDGLALPPGVSQWGRVYDTQVEARGLCLACLKAGRATRETTQEKASDER
ncbi:MAG: transcriptional repressor [Myxococcales bacterium]|nr:transcriptional repressor [Myxococcales bacterium]